jgi:glycogen(starch) synthase
MTAHDILPRRTASNAELWRRLYSRFGRVVVHSDAGRRRLIEEVGVSAERLVVIPHPVFPGHPTYRDAGPTLLFLGLIQPYKQLDHAIAVAHALGVRLIVAGDPTYDLGSLLAEPGIDWRLGYRPDAELDATLGEATLALFPYRAELDQSGALLRALGAGVPAVAYDVGGIAEPVRRFAAGAAVPPDDLAALTDAVRLLLEDHAALERARAGARRAAAELTWEASAAAHLAVYEALVG